MAETAFEVRGLTRQYGSRYAVRDLDLTVEIGDVYGFLGPNGAGKTTAMRAALGLIVRNTGTVRFFGEEEPLGRRHVGAIIEVPAFHEWLSGEENLALAAAYAGLRGREASTEIARVLERVALTERAKDRSGAYSLGMKQRLGIARALLGRPRLLMLDEPTNGLDPRGMREMRDLIRSLALNDAITVFISSHLLVEVQAICNRVGIIHAGTLRAEGTVESLLSESATAGVVEIATAETEKLRAVLADLGVAVLGPGEAGRLRVAHGERPISEVNRRLVEAGVPVDALVPAQRNLEDVFLEVTK
jgi:ABC-type multidrug transport system ATPase subunit